MGLSAAAIAAAAGGPLAAAWRSPVDRLAGDGQDVPESPRFAYVGTFNSAKRKARGEGLLAYHVDPVSGRWARVQVLGHEVNPSYLAIDPKRPVLYAVHSEANQVSSFSINDMTGELTLLNRQSCGGDNPVHLAIDATGRFLVVANYGSGSVVVLPVRPDGSLGGRSDLVTLQATPARTGPSSLCRIPIIARSTRAAASLSCRTRASIACSSSRWTRPEACSFPDPRRH